MSDVIKVNRRDFLKTGAVLAIANYPTYSLEETNRPEGDPRRKNRALSFHTHFCCKRAMGWCISLIRGNGAVSST